MWKLEIGRREISVSLSSNRVGLVENRMISQFCNIDSLFPIGLSTLLRTLLIALFISPRTKYSYSILHKCNHFHKKTERNEIYQYKNNQARVHVHGGISGVLRRGWRTFVPERDSAHFNGYAGEVECRYAPCC